MSARSAMAQGDVGNMNAAHGASSSHDPASCGLVRVGVTDTQGGPGPGHASPVTVPTIHQAREALTSRLEGRPTQQELIERNIMPGGSTHPALHAKQLRLGRAKTNDVLNRKLQNRPTKDEVVQRNIMKPGQPSPLVVERTRALDHHAMKERLANFIAEGRPGPLDVLTAGYFEAPGNLDVRRVIKREWPADTDDGGGACAVAEGGETSGSAPPNPPPLPTASPLRNVGDEPHASSTPFEFDTMLSPTSALKQPSLYSIDAGSVGDMDATAADGDFGLDFSLSGMNGMDLDWPSVDFPVEHGHIVQEQLRNAMQQVHGFLPPVGPLVEEFDKTAWNKLGVNQELTDVQSRATLPQRGIRPRVQAYRSSLDQAAAGNGGDGRLMMERDDEPPMSTTAENSGGGGGGSERSQEWASQLARMNATQQQRGGPYRPTVASGPRTAAGGGRKKAKKIKKFTYHNYTGPTDKKQKGASKRKPGSRVTPPSPNRQIVLHQQEQFLRLERIAQRRSSRQGDDADADAGAAAAAAAFAADAPRGNPSSRTPPDLDTYGTTTPMSLQSTLDSVNPSQQQQQPQQSGTGGGRGVGVGIGVSQASASVPMRTSSLSDKSLSEGAAGMYSGSMPSLGMDFGMGTDAMNGVVRRVPSPGSASGHRRAGSWGGRADSSFPALSSNRASTPLFEGVRLSPDGCRQFDSGFGHDMIDLGMLQSLGVDGDASMEDMGIAIDFDLRDH